MDRDRGFVKIRRGLRDHLGRMPDSSLKLYLWLHLAASWRGKQRGTIQVTYAGIAEELKWSVPTVKRAMASLKPRYVKIVQTGNQYSSTIIRILKYDKRELQAGVSPDPSRASIKNDPSRDPGIDPSILREPNKTLRNHAPKNLVESSRSTDKQQRAATLRTPNPKLEDSVWSFLGISPCGPGSFRTLLETEWAGRDRMPFSILIGGTLDAWEGAESRKPKGCAPLFRALSKLRENEKKIQKPSAITSEPIHVFTPEEIPA